jgi:hypothetical protein
MNAALATQACWIINRILWGRPEPGELRLEGGIVTFTSDGHGLVFRSPLAQVRASFPRVFPPFLHSSIGVKLTVRGKTYRLVFAWAEYRGWQLRPGGDISFGPRWSIAREGVKPAQAAVQQWRAALEKSTNGGH